MNFTEVKVNVVVIRGVNDHELLDFTEFAIRNDLHVRFIEFMPFTSNGWNRDHYMPAGTMKEIIGQRYSLYPLPPEDHSVSKDFIIEGHCGKISFITSVSEHFCDGCNRVRITAEGKLKPCLFSPPENDLDLRSVLRSETVTDEQVEAMIRTCILKKWKQHPEMEELSGNLAHEMIGIGG
jgi:cyclic pyranopterin phosphate synthase